MPLVSVIVVNYNYGRFLDGCLVSILNQTYPFIECIVVDNGSRDDSVQRLDAIMARGDFAREGRSLALLKLDVNLHQTIGSMKGFKESTGPYVIFFDADDVMLPECIETHIQAMLSVRPPVGATCVDYFMSRGDALIASTCGAGFTQYVTSGAGQTAAFSRAVHQPAAGLGAALNLRSSELHLVGRTATNWPWSGTCGLCFRREMVELMFSRAPALRDQLDTYLVRGINSLTGTVLIDRPLVVYRYHSSNIFATGAYIANFVNFSRDRQSGAAAKVAAEIIETFLAKSAELHQTLETPHLFVEAIDTVARTANLRPRRRGFRTYTFEFLIAHQDVLKQAFGAALYNEWIKRYRKTWLEWLLTRFPRPPTAPAPDENQAAILTGVSVRPNLGR